MMPHCKRDQQFELFECTTLAAHATPKLSLPIQRSSEIDVKRAAAILGVSPLTVYRMIRGGLLSGYQPRPGAEFKIDHASIVKYCEHLCVKYGISDKTAARPKSGRRRDRDLLPFPLDETISVKFVTQRLDCSVFTVIKLIEEGVLIAYKAGVDGSGAAWRIYGKSFDRYVESLHAAPSLRGNASSR